MDNTKLYSFHPIVFVFWLHPKTDIRSEKHTNDKYAHFDEWNMIFMLPTSKPNSTISHIGYAIMNLSHVEQ